MATNLVQCSDCNREVSKYAKACPHCGAPMNWNGGYIFFAVAILLAVALFAWLSFVGFDY